MTSHITIMQVCFFCLNLLLISGLYFEFDYFCNLENAKLHIAGKVRLYSTIMYTNIKTRDIIIFKQLILICGNFMLEY